MLDLYALTRPALFRIDPENAHNLTLKALKTGLLPRPPKLSNTALEQNLWGLHFPNPVGLSAGFDKNAEVVGPALKLGFGFVEAGTVTPKQQDGNPKPRVFRASDHDAVINRMGFPNGGMQVFKTNMERFLSRKPRPAGVIGINIGMNKTQEEPAKDYRMLIRNLGPMADYLTINISSPNTPGLRDLQQREPLLKLLEAVMLERKRSCGSLPPPVMLKLAPDLDEAQCEELAKAAIEGGVDGLILSNTTLDRPENLPEDFRNEAGGLSGQPLTDKSTETIRRFYTHTKGQIPIIGVGGIANGWQAYEKIKAGASLVQLYSSLVFKGPFVAYYINMELLKLLNQDGYSSISEAIGTDNR